ncbi:glyoxalase [Actinoallomurus iriomotensis]|uniref:Glyoxalase n=2 Tax=Actinoallomurus iriomotensis TaxID=478107 RepID=A0A9W6S1J1_9ACTN|nr:glyoxalase [Actinoallomurus iriomotensis]
MPSVPGWKHAAMSTTLRAFVLGTPDPPALADFYRDLLGMTEVSREPEWVRLRFADEERPGLSFQLEPEHVPPVWPPRPGTPQMQAHLDVLVDDLDAEVARAVALGATVEEHQPTPEGVRVMRDPHGHLFCLFLLGW